MKIVYNDSENVGRIMQEIERHVYHDSESRFVQKNYNDAKSLNGMFYKNKGFTRKQLDALVYIKYLLTPRFA